MSGLAIKITEVLVIYLPLVRILVIVSVAVAATVYLFRIRFPRHKWLTICARLLASALCMFLVLAFILTMLFLAFIGGVSGPRATVSPDSKHIAYHYYQAGFLSRDITSVLVGKRWDIHPEAVYEYAGPSDWTDTQVNWLGNNRLVIRYFLDNDSRLQQCTTAAAGILVQCVPLRR